MNEQEINRLLRAGTTLAIRYEKEGKKELATQVLQMTSKICAPYLAQFHHKVYCPRCGRHLKTSQELEFLKHEAQCMNCDSGQADFYDNLQRESEGQTCLL